MPRRAAVGDRLAIEAALTPTLRGALAELCHLFAVPRDRWQRVPVLEHVFTMAAIANEAERLHRENGTKRDQIEAAADRLGVSPDTARNRLEAAFKNGRATKTFKQVCARACGKDI